MHTTTGTAIKRPTTPNSIAPQTNEMITTTGWISAASPSTTGPMRLSIDTQDNHKSEEKHRGPDPVLLSRRSADRRYRDAAAGVLPAPDCLIMSGDFRSGRG